MTMGRPTKYSDEILEMTRDYIENFTPEKGKPIPTLAGLSVVIKVNRDTIREWGKQEDKADFSGALGELGALQEEALIGGGLDGSYNPTIAKLLLHGHGHSDKTENINTEKVKMEDLTPEQLSYVAKHGKLPA